MSTTITALLANLLGQFLLSYDIAILPEQLESTFTVLFAIGSVIFLWFKRYKEGDINPVGVRKA